jgi:murein DD-endopeptidase MepM/ murein hydrolase activator NlpD
MSHRRARAAPWLTLACVLGLPAGAADGQSQHAAAAAAGGPAFGAASAATAPAAARTPVPTAAGLRALPSATPPPPAARSLRVVTARRGDTLARMLGGAGIGAAEAEPAIAALAALFPARALQPGHEISLLLDPGRGGALLGLDIEPEPGRRLRARRGPDGDWRAREELPDGRRSLVLARGEVRGALIANLEAAGLPAPLALALVRVLAHEVDFERDLRPGDRFSILFERFRDADGALLRHGEILHAAFDLSGRRLSLWRHEAEEGGGADWFDDVGRSLRRALLRTPLDGASLSSGFGGRLHPVLGFNRAHQGVDFAAPAGTPVYASGDGVVEDMGRRGGYGLMVRLAHPGGAETRYAHLSAFARGLRPGSPVRQGEVIGRVGSTGLSTGPHLHYEIRLAGRPVDPARAVPQPSVQLAGRALDGFLAARHATQTQLARLAPMQEVAWAD